MICFAVFLFILKFVSSVYENTFNSDFYRNIRIETRNGYVTSFYMTREGHDVHAVRFVFLLLLSDLQWQKAGVERDAIDPYNEVAMTLREKIIVTMILGKMVVYAPTRNNQQMI